MVQVNVNEGILEGELVDNEYGGKFYSFKGIPYAEPPIGDLRFKAPQPKKPWDGVRMAKELGPSCYQYDVILRQIPENSSEDCLYLNVYTPEIEPNTPLPVMVFIHGGAYVSGSGNDDVHGPEFLVRHGVILVTFNYRLEALGFLCLDTEDIPGNAGMKDQVAALKWVKSNISNLGGDPENVTIFGESAGGASVSFHLVSPMSKGLFKRAIVQSGAACCPWASPFEPRQRALALARKLGLESEDDKELYEFFKTRPLEDLIKLEIPLTTSEAAKQNTFCFGVVSEKKFGDSERFFYGDILDVFRNAGIHDGVDVMTGYNEHEGIFLLATGGGPEKLFEKLNKFNDVMVPKHIEINCLLRDQLKVSKEFKEYYFKEGTPCLSNWEPLVRYYSFDTFIYNIIQEAKIIASKQKNNVYVYKFCCKSERNIMAHVLGMGPIIGNKPVVAHADDLCYIFPMKILGQKVDTSSDTFKIIDNVTTLWTNFAKYGNPTPDDSLGVQWTPYDLESQAYLNIGNELTLETEPDKEDIEFWENIFKKYLPSRVHNGSN